MKEQSFARQGMNRRTLIRKGAALMGGMYAGLSLRPGRAMAQNRPAEAAASATAQTMSLTRLGEFAASLRFEDLPESVIAESRRMMLDSMGCALAGVGSEKGKWGMEYARNFFSGPAQATAIGFGEKLSLPGACFVNAELINGLDHDLTSFNGPGHVTPFVVPPLLALCEQKKMSGKDFLVAFAIAHELTERIGANLSNGSPQDTGDGKSSAAPVSGCSSVVFGGAAALGKLEQFSAGQLAQAMGMVAHMAPMQAAQTMLNDMPPTTAKYLMAGWAAQTQMAAVYLIKAGHRGDVTIMDQPWGFPRFAGFGRWNASKALAGLGQEWRYDKTTRYKAYPACGIMRGALDCLGAVLKKNNLRPEEIEHVHAYIEPSCTLPIFNNRTIGAQVDAQFSVPYNMAVLCHGVALDEWQSVKTMRSPQIIKFMEKVTFEPHPHYDAAQLKDPRAHLEKVVVTARGTTFDDERPYFKGSPSPDPTTTMTDEDLLEKFRINARAVLPAAKIQEAARQLMALEQVKDMSELMALLHA